MSNQKMRPALSGMYITEWVGVHPTYAVAPVLTDAQLKAEQARRQCAALAKSGGGGEYGDVYEVSE